MQQAALALRLTEKDLGRLKQLRCQRRVECVERRLQQRHLAEVFLLEVGMSDQLQLGLDESIQGLKYVQVYIVRSEKVNEFY